MTGAANATIGPTDAAIGAADIANGTTDAAIGAPGTDDTAPTEVGA